MQKTLLELSIVLLVFSFSIFANAAEIAGKEVLCNYTFKTVHVDVGNPEVIPLTENGRVKLSEVGSSYGPVEVKFGSSFSAIMKASIATDMSLEMKIKTENPSSQTLGQAVSFHRDNEIGVFQGALDILSNEISSLADQEKMSFEDASVSKKLSPGFHFVSASINCF